MAKVRILTDAEREIYDEAFMLANKLNGRLKRFDTTIEFRGDYDRAIKLAKSYNYLQPNGRFVRKSFKSMNATYVKQTIIPALKKSLQDPKGKQRLLKPTEEELDEKRKKILKDFRKAFGDETNYKDVQTYFNYRDLSLWRELTDNVHASEAEYEAIYNAQASNFTYNGKTGLDAYISEYFDKVPYEMRSLANFMYEYFQLHPTIRNKYKFLNTSNN